MKRPGLTRRDVLRLAGASGAVMFVGCGDNEGSRDPGIEHASAVIEPESTSFIVVVWSGVARTAALEVQEDDEVVYSTAVELDRDSGTAAIEVGALEPGRHYQATIVWDTGARMIHHVRTAPRADDPRPVRIAVSADIDPNPEFASGVFEQLAAASPELFVCLGDFPYADNGPGPAMTVEQYRGRYVEAYTSPPIRKWMQSMGIRSMYDDHEFRNDWDAMYRTVESSRYAAAMQVWDEFFPLRGGATGEVRYRSWRWGAHLECFLLDVRRFRSANANLDDDTKTMLGDVQRTWLIDGVTRSTAPFKVVFTPVPLDYGDGNDHWASFTNERTRIFNALVGVPGVLFVSADQHVFAAHRHLHGIREFQVGPLARGLGMPKLISGNVLFRSSQFNFGLIDVDATQLTFSGVGADGTVFYKETLTADALKPTV